MDQKKYTVEALTPRIEGFLRPVIDKADFELDFEVLLPGHGEPLMEGARHAVQRMMSECGRLD